MDFPHFRYHRDGRNMIVRSPEELEKLGPDWYRYPVEQLSEEAFLQAGLDAVMEGIPVLVDPPPVPRAAPPPIEPVCGFCKKPGHTARTCPVRGKRK